MDKENKQKMVQAMTFFIKETGCNKTKLYWLLFYLDLEALTRFGESVTGLDYNRFITRGCCRFEITY